MHIRVDRTCTDLSLHLLRSGRGVVGGSAPRHRVAADDVRYVVVLEVLLDGWHCCAGVASVLLRRLEDVPVVHGGFISETVENRS